MRPYIDYVITKLKDSRHKHYYQIWKLIFTYSLEKCRAIQIELKDIPNYEIIWKYNGLLENYMKKDGYKLLGYDKITKLWAFNKMNIQNTEHSKK